MKGHQGKSGAGSILVLVLMVTAALLIIGSALLIVTLTESAIAQNQEQDLKLYYITEAGIEAGVALLGCAGDLSGAPITGSLGGGSYSTEIVGEPGLPLQHPYYKRLPQRLAGGRHLVISTGRLKGRIMVMAIIAGVEENPSCDEAPEAGGVWENNSGSGGVVIEEWINPWRL